MNTQTDGPAASDARQREIEMAFLRGQRIGASVEGWAGICPYPYFDRKLRRAWMDGFSKGRIARKARQA